VRGSSKPSQHSIKRSKTFSRAANQPRPGRIHPVQYSKISPTQPNNSKCDSPGVQSCLCSGVAEGCCAARREREEVVVARNAKGYIKGLCMYVVRDHATYGRMIDVPVFIVASAADGEGVAEDLIDFLMSKCDRSVCSGIRFWGLNPEIWAHRLRPDYIARSDHGLFLPAVAGAGGVMKLRAQVLSITQAIDRFSR
jgi:hypothetical protein